FSPSSRGLTYGAGGSPAQALRINPWIGSKSRLRGFQYGFWVAGNATFSTGFQLDLIYKWPRQDEMFLAALRKTGRYSCKSWVFVVRAAWVPMLIAATAL